MKAIYQRAHRYAQRGTWLIPAENLFRYLLGLMETSAEEYRRAEGERSESPDGNEETPGKQP